MWGSILKRLLCMPAITNTHTHIFFAHYRYTWTTLDSQTHFPFHSLSQPNAPFPTPLALQNQMDYRNHINHPPLIVSLATSCLYTANRQFLCE